MPDEEEVQVKRQQEQQAKRDRVDRARIRNLDKKVCVREE
jgi:hypothetical protein